MSEHGNAPTDDVAAAKAEYEERLADITEKRRNQLERLAHNKQIMETATHTITYEIAEEYVEWAESPVFADVDFLLALVDAQAGQLAAARAALEGIHQSIAAFDETKPWDMTTTMALLRIISLVSEWKRQQQPAAPDAADSEAAT